MRRAAFRILAVLAAFVLVTAPAATADEAYRPLGMIEAAFAEPGPWAVSSQLGMGCCDSTGAAYDVWYPTDLGAHGVHHPIITWGNGTNAVPSQYDYLLRHLASWGFVVIATENRNTGSGADIAGAVRFLIEQAADPSSIFHDRLNTEAVGAMGHSQGATGVLNAMIGSGGAIKTAVATELPAQAFCGSPERCTDTHRLSSGSVLFVNGSSDALISPSEQLPGLPGLQSNRAYYEATPASVTKAWGTLNGPNHNDIQGQPDCAQASKPCTTGVYGYLGYPTAWLVARLWGCGAAGQGFIPGSGEFYRPNPYWANQIGAEAS
ncbi:alpha/beta hydrolase [Nocardia transvalensis]|uniref:poly(ethylene terephthalate) hydrolase family protein n=1 Tax=Nocardia transvalensis TaxID=37333 RepID=UPI001896390F|nr:alpha/beta hydrolase [Nocardia transvalensis]MBF6329453.1 alpha/beta hydrolase [Nocardia transvalensis]